MPWAISSPSQMKEWTCARIKMNCVINQLTFYNKTFFKGSNDSLYLLGQGPTLIRDCGAHAGYFSMVPLSFYCSELAWPRGKIKVTTVTVIYTLFSNPICPKRKLLNFINTPPVNINFQMCLRVTDICSPQRGEDSCFNEITSSTFDISFQSWEKKNKNWVICYQVLSKYWFNLFSHFKQWKYLNSPFWKNWIFMPFVQLLVAFLF